MMNASYAIRKSMASIERINTILTTPTSDYQNQNERVEVKEYNNYDNNIEIEYQNVSFAYEEGKEILKDVNIKIYKNEKVLIIGKIGVGKTTLIDLLFRFNEINRGNIYVKGQNIKTINIKDLISKIAYVNQDSICLNDTFYNNIVFGRDNIS